MAEEFFDFIDTTTFTGTDSFSGFEELWRQMGEELEKEALHPCYFPAQDANLTKDLPPSVLQNAAASGYCAPPPPPLIIDEGGLGAMAEDSILTTFRRKNPGKYNRLENRLVEPSGKSVGLDHSDKYKDQFKVLKSIKQRIADDLKQMTVIINYLENELKGKKRVKFCSMEENELTQSHETTAVQNH